MSPGLAFGAIIVLIGAQVTRVVAPRHASYPWAFVFAAAGFVAAELFAFATNIGGPPLGALHPFADAVGIAAVEVVGSQLTSPGRSPRVR